MNADRWAGRARMVAAGADSADVYAPAAAGDVLNVRQLRVSASAAAEVVVYWDDTTADPAAVTAIPPDDVVFGVFLAANTGASPDLGCLGAWSPRPGLRLRVYTAAAATVQVAAEGTIEP